MFQQKRAYWRDLDNAANMFSAASSPKDTRVFRFYCVLKEDIQKEILQEALNRTIKKYPIFLSVMRKGLFWHYLEKSELRPVVREEDKEPCSSLYVHDKKALLFEVTYYKKRINFEVFHALTDGTGATEFTKELIKNYLYLSHREEGLPDIALAANKVTVHDQENDSFSKYYNPDASRRRTKKPRAYQIRRFRKEYDTLKVVEAEASVQELLAVSRARGVSMSVLLAAAYICAIHEDMSKVQEKKPVILMVPVNLRKIFPSDSMLNFFSYIEPGYKFGEGNDDFEAVLEAVKVHFKDNLTKEEIARRMNELIALEKHKILKWTPLELKNRCIRVGAKMAEGEVSAVFSNMSAVKMPEEYVPYIEKFGVYNSTPRMELCTCSFGDTMSFAFTSRYDSSNIQRNFYRILEELGVEIKLCEPDYPEDVEPNYKGMKIFQTFSFCCIAAVVIGIMGNAIFTPERYWVAYEAAGTLSMWIAFATAYLKRYNLMKNAMWQLLIMTIGSVLWDYFTGWHRWSVNYMVPLVCVAVLAAMMVISKIQSHSPREYMIYYVMATVYSMILPFVLLITHVVTFRIPSVICIGISALFLLSLIVFKGREFKEEMHKKLHV